MHSPKTPSHRRIREMAAGADGVVAVDPAVNRKLRARQVLLAAEPVDEARHGGDLAVGWRMVLEVADEADAQAGIVHVLVADMPPTQLMDPTGPHLNFAVAGVVAVTDDEVVCQAVLVTAPAVLRPVSLCIARLHRAVVGGNVTPAGSIHLHPTGGRN